MKTDAILIFDIGKSNKKVLIFDLEFHLLYEHDVVFDEIHDDDLFPCDDIEKIEAWIQESLTNATESDKFNIVTVNLSTYGASLVYLDENKKRLAPVYNYLKPMPDRVMENFYDKYGGIEEFCRVTASPALGMLNSGLQIRWLKMMKPKIFLKIRHILHLPHYLSFLLTGKITSESTSIGCHTAMWNFDEKKYHRWLADENIELPEPIENSNQTEINFRGKKIMVGPGIHDSSASLVPYLKGSKEKFILISTGTWCVFMNPFNEEPLKAEQLKKDTLCYLSPAKKQVKSSRLFLGHIHKVNEENIAGYFGKPKNCYKEIKFNKSIIEKLNSPEKAERKFFKNGIPADYIDREIDYSDFKTYEETYHRLILDLIELSWQALKLIIPLNDESEVIYITGGFAKNDLYTSLLSLRIPGKKIYTSKINNASALGAAMVLESNDAKLCGIKLNLKEIEKPGN